MLTFRNYPLIFILIMIGITPSKGWGKDTFIGQFDAETDSLESDDPHSLQEGATSDLKGEEDLKLSTSPDSNPPKSSTSNSPSITPYEATPTSESISAIQTGPKKASTQKVRKRSLPTRLDIAAKTQQIQIEASKVPHAALDSVSNLPNKMGKGISNIGKLPGIKHAISGVNQTRRVITNTMNQSDYFQSSTRREIHQINRQSYLNTAVNGMKYSEKTAKAQKIVQGTGKTLHHAVTTGSKTLIGGTKAIVTSPLKLQKMIGKAASSSTTLKNASRTLNDGLDYTLAGAKKLRNNTRIPPISKHVKGVGIEATEYFEQKLTTPLGIQRQQLNNHIARFDQKKRAWVDQKMEPLRNQLTDTSNSINNFDTKVKNTWDANINQQWNYYSNDPNELGKLQAEEKKSFLENIRKKEEVFELNRKNEIAQEHQKLEKKAGAQIEKLQAEKRELLTSQKLPNDPKLNRYENERNRRIDEINRKERVQKIGQEINEIKSELKKKKAEKLEEINKKFKSKREAFRITQEEERQNINRRHAYDRRKKLLDYHKSQSNRRKEHFDQKQGRAKQQIEQKYKSKDERINAQHQARVKELENNLQENLNKIADQHTNQQELINSKFENKEKIIRNKLQYHENKIELEFNYEKDKFEKKHQRSLSDIKFKYEKKIEPLKKEIKARESSIKKKFEEQRKALEKTRKNEIEKLKETNRKLQNTEIIKNREKVKGINREYNNKLKGKTNRFEREKILADFKAALGTEKIRHEGELNKNKEKLSEEINTFNDKFDNENLNKINEEEKKVLQKDEILQSKNSKLDRLTINERKELKSENDTYSQKAEEYSDKKLQQTKNSKTKILQGEMTKLKEDKKTQIQKIDKMTNEKANQVIDQNQELKDNLDKIKKEQTHTLTEMKQAETNRLNSLQKKELSSFNKRFKNADNSIMNKYFNTGNKHAAWAESLEKEINENYADQKNFREEEAQNRYQNKTKLIGDKEETRLRGMEDYPSGDIKRVDSQQPVNSPRDADHPDPITDSRRMNKPNSSNEQIQPSLDESLRPTSETSRNSLIEKGEQGGELTSNSDHGSKDYANNKGGSYEEVPPSPSSDPTQVDAPDKKSQNMSPSENENKTTAGDPSHESEELSKENTKKEKNWMQPCMMAAMLDLQFGQRVSSHARQEKTRRNACKVIKSLNIPPAPSISGTSDTLGTHTNLPPAHNLGTGLTQSSGTPILGPTDSSVQNITHSVLCYFHAEGCPSNPESNFTEQDLGSRSSAIDRGAIDSDLVPNLMNLLGEHGDDFINQALQDGATAALMGITPPFMGQVGASLASINERAASDPLLSKFFGPNANLALGSRSNSDFNLSPEALRKKLPSSDQNSNFVSPWNSNSKNSLEENSSFKSQNFDIWHTNTNQNIFQIVSEKITQVSSRLY